MRRGEVWRYAGLRERDVLIVQANAAAPTAPTVMAIPLASVDDVIETLTTIRINGTWIADTTRVGEFRRVSLTKRMATVPAHEMDQLGAALRLALDLG